MDHGGGAEPFAGMTFRLVWRRGDQPAFFTGVNVRSWKS